MQCSTCNVSALCRVSGGGKVQLSAWHGVEPDPWHGVEPDPWHGVEPDPWHGSSH